MVPTMDIMQISQSESTLVEESDDKMKNMVEDLTKVAEDNIYPAIAVASFIVILFVSLVSYFFYRRHKQRVDVLMEDHLQLSGENLGTESPRAPEERQQEESGLESIGDEERSKRVGVSKSNQKSNHEDSGLPDISSERSGIEAREGGEKMNDGKRYSRMSPGMAIKGSATTQKYPIFSNENPFKGSRNGFGSPGSKSSKK